MGNSEQAVTNLRRKLEGRTYTWLARETGLSYRRLLAEIKHGTKTLTLDVAVEAADALDCELPELLKAA